MKVFLLHRERDFQVRPELRDAALEAMLSGNLYALGNLWHERQRRAGALTPLPETDEALIGDLELDTLWSAMANGDEFLFEMAKHTILSSLHDPDAIVYRQQVLADCLEHPAVVRELYRLALEALNCDRQVAGMWSKDNPSLTLQRSVQLLGLYVNILRQLRAIADEHSASFRSDGFTRFFAMIADELDDEYLATVERYLGELKLAHGMLESAQLGKGDVGRRYVVHQPPRGRSWRERLEQLGRRGPEEYSFELAPRDEAGARALRRIRGLGLNHVADAVARSADHVKSFFTMLRLELAFYLGCLNLRARLDRRGDPSCFPEPLPSRRPALSADGLYDVCLALSLEDSDTVVTNDVAAEGTSLVVVTGANQGGKSTLLRAVGVAQLMMQSGMFVGARSLRASVRSGVFTHYKREEDATMEGGKLDEELRRMSGIAGRIAPEALLLCNESFASTNEREGSQIARQVIDAMLDKRITVWLVTHMYDLAHSLHERGLPSALFLRAEREPDGRRTFKLNEAEPLPTSYGEDSYRRVFGQRASSSRSSAVSGHGP
jgi:hypothetical protein